MVALLHPGVYIREVPSGARSIEGAPTSTAIFVGETDRGPLLPTKIRGIGDYERLFGGYWRAGTNGPLRVTMRYAIDHYFLNGGSTACVLRAFSGSAGIATRSYTDTNENNPVTYDDVISASSPGIWANGIRVIFLPSSTERFRLVVLVPNITTGALELVEDWNRLSLDPRDENWVEGVLRRSTYIRWTAPPDFSLVDFNNESRLDQNAPLDADPNNWTVDDFIAAYDITEVDGGTGGDAALTGFSTALQALDGIRDASLLVAAPEGWAQAGVSAQEDPDVAGLAADFKAYVDARAHQDLFFIADLPRGDGSTSVPTGDTIEAAETLSSTMTAAYWPHLRVADPVGRRRNATILLPPSAAIAGLYARTDARRGVFKAPAGTEATLAGVVGLEHEILDSHQDELNPAGVNAIRRIPGAGVVAWGARTLRPTSEWRYVSVRRTAMFLRASIYAGIQWAVFEPNNRELWTSLYATIDAFMSIQFRNGMFAGSSPNDAYFVKVDDETTTEADQAAGIVNILVGFAPQRPAEFVVVKLSQMTGSAG